MIYIGNDLVEVDRIQTLIERWADRFLLRIFTPDEITYCQRRAKPALHFAGRFAAKEAVKKALYSSGRIPPVLFRQIQIHRDQYGAPIVHLPGLEWNLRVSISHTTNYAAATAILFHGDSPGESR
ncbi:MAG: holo-ACP synthase [Fidelibacterota bacterium]|nr:MAG: holo-ACP synthase [Candidatus Neomarinimicrobiota bacterium]